MNRFKSIVGLSLLSALLLCAVAAQSAQAAWEPATNLTAYTCVPGGGGLDFTDAHCDHQVTPGTGSFGHEKIANGVKTEIETSNKQTASETTAAQPAVLKSTILGNAVTITCKKVEPDTNATSFIINEEPSAEKHNAHGTSAVNFTECNVEGNGKACSVAEPITLKTLFEGVEEPNTKGMAIEFKPDPAGEPYVTIKFTGTCLLSEAKVTGLARGTGSGTTGGGATLEFKPEDEELFFAGVKATFEGKFTTRMAGGGNPITFTTTGQEI